MKRTSINPLITKSDSHSLDLYFKDIRKYDLLTKEEELKYLKMRETNFDYAINKLMEGNLRLVISIAKLYQNSEIPLEDLIQIGNLGMYQALKTYDDKAYTTKLADYLSYKIRGEILNTIGTEKSSLTIPRYIYDKIGTVNKFMNDYFQKNEYYPDLSEIAENCNISEENVQLILFAANLDIQNESQNISEDNIPILETISSEQPSLIDPYFEKIIRSYLTDIEFDILTKLVGYTTSQQTASQLAVEYNISVERVRAIYNKAINKLQQHPELLNYF